MTKKEIALSSKLPEDRYYMLLWQSKNGHYYYKVRTMEDDNIVTVNRSFIDKLSSRKLTTDGIVHGQRIYFLDAKLLRQKVAEFIQRKADREAVKKEKAAKHKKVRKSNMPF